METQSKEVFTLEQSSLKISVGLLMFGEMVFYFFSSFILFFLFLKSIGTPGKLVVILFVAALPFWAFGYIWIIRYVEKKYYAEVEATVDDQNLILNTIKEGYKTDLYDEAIFPWQQLISYQMTQNKGYYVLTLTWKNGKKQLFVAGEHKQFFTYIKANFSNKQIKNWYDSSANT